MNLLGCIKVEENQQRIFFLTLIFVTFLVTY